MFTQSVAESVSCQPETPCRPRDVSPLCCKGLDELFMIDSRRLVNGWSRCGLGGFTDAHCFVPGRVEAECLRGDGRRLREEGHALDHIGELPDVARPAMGPERGEGVSGEALRGESIVGAGSAEQFL